MAETKKARKKREDIHRPGAIEPKDYEFVAYTAKTWDYGFHAEATGLIAIERTRLGRHMDRTGGDWAAHSHGGSCMVCGARAIYLATFYHEKSNSYVCTGCDCAAKLGMGDKDLFRKINDAVKAAQKCRTGRKKAEGLLLEADLARAWQVYAELTTPCSDDYEGALKAAGAQGDELARMALRDLWLDAGLDPDRQPVPWGDEERTVKSVVETVVKTGRMSDRQKGFLATLLGRIDGRAEAEADRLRREEEKAARKAAEDAVTADVLEGRYTARCEILKLDTKENPDGSTRYVMTVRVLSGNYRAWGTRPASMEDAKVGDRIDLTASFERSDKDPKFGFFKRPIASRVAE